MIIAVLWLLLVAGGAWELWKHGIFAAAVPALAVMGWCTVCAFGLAWFVTAYRKRAARRAAQLRAELDALRSEVRAEYERQVKGSTQGGKTP
jgi:hypothetical protein